VFQDEHTGQKADPANISKAVQRATQSNGSSIFEKDDLLTPLQIARFLFSLNSKRNLQDWQWCRKTVMKKTALAEHSFQ